MRHHLQQRFALLELLLKLRSGSVDAFSEIAQPALGARVEPHGPVAASQFADRVRQASQPADKRNPDRGRCRCCQRQHEDQGSGEKRRERWWWWRWWRTR